MFSNQDGRSSFEGDQNLATLHELYNTFAPYQFILNNIKKSSSGHDGNHDNTNESYHN